MALSIGASNPSFGLTNGADGPPVSLLQPPANVPPVARETAAPAPPPQVAAPGAPQAAPQQQAAGPKIPKFSENPIGAIGFLLESFGNGVLGRELPIDRLERQAAAQQGARLKQAALRMDAISKGMEFIEDAEDKPAAIDKWVELTGQPEIRDFMLEAAKIPKIDLEKLTAMLSDGSEAGILGLRYLEAGVKPKVVLDMFMTIEAAGATATATRGTPEDAAERERLKVKAGAEARADVEAGQPPSSPGAAIAPVFQKMIDGETLEPGEREALDAFLRTGILDQLLRFSLGGGALGGGAAGAGAAGETINANPADFPEGTIIEDENGQQFTQRGGQWVPN